MHTHATPNLVSATRWWITEAAPQEVLAWFITHPPDGATQSGDAVGATHGKADWWGLEFTFPSSSDQFDVEELCLTVAPFLSGAAVRADAMVVWRRPRSQRSLVPPGMCLLTVRLMDGIPPRMMARRIFSDEATIDAIRNLINELLPCVPGPRTGTLDRGLRALFSFSAECGDRVRWTVTVDPSHGLAMLSGPGRQRAALDDREGRLLGEAHRLCGV